MILFFPSKISCREMGFDGERNTTMAKKKKKKKREGLSWIEWGRGWLKIIGELMFQRIMASQLGNPLPLPPLDGATFIVTGSTSVIGLNTARQLAMGGAHVVMAVRKAGLGKELIREWQEEKGAMGMPLNVEVMELDLLSLESIVRFAETWNARDRPLHALINNAGIFAMGEPQRFSKDGYEVHMQVNHLAPALLSMLILPSLQRGSPSRIINVNSIARNLPKILIAAYHLIPCFLFNAQEGCRSTIFAASDPQMPEYCGALKADEWPVCPCIGFDCRPMNASEEAHNLETSREIWEKTLELIGLPSDSLEKLLKGQLVHCRYNAAKK